MSEKCNLKEGEFHIITGGSGREQSKEIEQGVSISVPGRAEVEALQRAPGNIHTHYCHCPQEKMTIPSSEVTAAGTLLSKIVHWEI